MMKKVLLLGILLLYFVGLSAQTENYALHFAQSENKVTSKNNPALESATNFSVEAWVKVDAWNQGATILSYGSAFSLKLGESGKLIATMGEATATVAHTSLAVGKWNLLTLSYDGTTASRLLAFVNAEAATVTGAEALPAVTPSGSARLVLGGGLIGWMDEIRIWKKSLAKADIILKTTISPYNNNYESLAAYYKCDQFTSAGLVDYSNSQCHGQFTPDNSLRQKVTDNAVLRYNTMTGYIGLSALANGKLQDKGQLETCNDIALLAALRVNTNTGETYFEYPDNTGTLTNAEYAATFTAPKTPQGTYVTAHAGNAEKLSRVTRNGILEFKGTDAKMNVGDVNLDGTKVTFNTWLYVKEWTPGAALFERKGTNGDEVSLKMGESDGLFIFTVSAMASGKRYTEVYPFETTFKNTDEATPDLLTTSTLGDYQYWHFLSFVFNGEAKMPVSLAFDKFIQQWIKGGTPLVLADKKKVTQNGTPMSINSITENLDYKIKRLPLIGNGDMFVGKDLDGYMDEISFWGVDRTDSQRSANDGFDEGLGIGEKGVYYTIQNLKAYYRVMDAANPAKDYMNVKDLFANLQKQLEGNRGYKIRLSVTGVGTRDWRAMIKDTNVREKAAKNIAATITNNPIGYKFAGLDFDFEWAEDKATMDAYALFLKDLRKYMPQGSENGLLSIAVNGTMPWSCKLAPEAVELVDFFTAEDYGPFAVKFTYDSYLSSQKVYGETLPANKMMSSIGVYAVGDEKGQINSEPYANFANLITDFSVNRLAKPGDKGYFYNFCGVNQTTDRVQYAMDKDYYGFMIFDMVCDILPSDPKSITRAIMQIMPSNNEAIVEVDNAVDAEARVNGDLIADFSTKGSAANITEMILTGKWTEADLKTLRAAIKPTADLTTANQKLQTVDMSGLTLAASATAVEFLVFQNCQNLETIKMPTATINVPVAIGHSSNNGLFQNCKSLKEADISMFTNITNLQGTFFGCTVLETITMPTVCSQTSIPANNCVKNCGKLKSIDLSMLNNPNLTDAFQGNGNLLYAMLPTSFRANPFTYSGNPTYKVEFNPNCLAYILSNYTNPQSAKINILKSTDSGIIYACATKITLDPAKEFMCPIKFTATAGIEYTRTITKSTDSKLGWESICLPYDVTAITKGSELLIIDSNCSLSTAASNENFATASIFSANIPYIFQMSAATGDVTFANATDVEVQATTGLTNTSSKDFDMACAYLNVAASEAVYALDNTGAEFVKNGGVVAPFHAYVVNKTGVLNPPAKYTIAQDATGIDASANDKASALNIYAADGKLVIESAKAQIVKVSSIDGITRSLNVTEGANQFQLPQGIYIINKQKVIVR